jgi:predicted lipoprotein with Yx(FWY)xxD motif
VSTCFDDCLLAWPIFEAGDRELAEGLDDHALGTFVRADGSAQTTYYGWPLYYYRRDEAPGDTLGQGKGGVWYLAELEMPNVVIMRAPEEREGIKYLADGRGFTLYTHDDDVPGTTTAPPRPECTGECRGAFRPFNVRSLRPVTDLEPGLFTVFADPASGGQQVSFRGLPLYLSKHDATSGDMNGLEQDGFKLVLP